MIILNTNKVLLTSSGELNLSASIFIPRGAMVAFYGASGTGKTTLLRIIAGLTSPDNGSLVVDGEIWLDSQNGKSLAPNKRSVGFVFQDYSLFPNMTVWENICFGLNDGDTRKVDDLLDLMELGSLRDRKPCMLSGGQQQRVALARAIVRMPKLLLLDEPLSALDHKIRCELQDLIKRTCAEFGITTIIVSHDMSEIFKLCSRVFSFCDGTVVDKGAPADMFSNNPISGKVQFVGEVLDSKEEDIIKVITLLVGNTPVKIAISNPLECYSPGDKVLIASKAFNPILQKI